MTVSFGRARQVFDLEAPEIFIGRDPDASLVLPMEWVEPGHVVITPDLNDGLRVRPAAEFLPVRFNGESVAAGGVYVPPRTPFELRIPSHANEGVLLEVEQVAAAPVVKNSLGRRLRAELLGGLAMLAGAVALAVYLLVTRPSIPAPLPPTTMTSTTQPSPQEMVNDAAAAYSAGETLRARELLAAATAAGARGPMVDVLTVALRSASPEDTKAPATEPSTQPAPMPAEPKVDFEGRQVTTGERDAILRQREDEKKKSEQVRENEARDAKARDDAAAREKSEAEQRAILATAEEDLKSGKDARFTDLGRSALRASKAAIKSRTGKAELTFPDDTDERIVVVYREGQYTIRGFADEWNQAKIPVRLFYLVRLKPIAADKWETLAVELLK